MATPGWATLGNTLAGGNQVPAELAEVQGESIGANTANAIANANARIAKNKALENLPNVLRANPEFSGALGDTIAGVMQAGGNPQEAYGARESDLKTNLRTGIADANTPDPQVARNAMALGENPQELRTVGSEGFTNVLHPDQGVGQTPLGAALASGHVAQANASATNSLAEADLHGAQAALVRSGGKPPTNMQWAVNDDGTPKVDANGQRVAVPITGSKADPNTAGPMSAVEARTMERVINSGKQAASMLTNIAKMPSTINAGVLGTGSAPGHSILQTTIDDFKNRLAPQDVQQYTTVMTGLNQALATMETFGMMPRGSFTDSMNRLVLRDGDTVMSKATKMADARQIFDNATETLMNNPRLPPQQKAYIEKMRAQVATAIPYTVEDTLALAHAPPGTSLGELVKGKAQAVAAGAAPAGTPAPGAPTPRSFNTEAEAEAALTDADKGKQIIVGGRPATWQ